MKYFLKKFQIWIIVTLFLSFPSVIFSQVENYSCSSKGYTITTVNGVFTNDSEAKENKENLKKRLPGTYNNEPLTIEYLLNPSHLAGLGDIATSVYQKAFENETVGGYDLREMIYDASQKVKTKKLLLVAHSQGNFYANSFYDTVADKDGGVPAESIGIYSVANPASRVAGGGQWLTSDTDKVIAGVVARVPFKKIMPPNTHIVLGANDDAVGHGFSQAYLKYRSSEIIAGIQSSLDKLSADQKRDQYDLCIETPKLSFLHKTEGVVLAVADPVAEVGVKVAVTTAKAGVNATVWTYNTTEDFAKWASHMEAVAIKWTYRTTVTVAKTAWGMASSIGSSTYNALTGEPSNNQSANNNSASVILATEPAQKSLVSVSNTQTNVAVPIIQPQTLPTQIAVETPTPQTVLVFEPKMQSGTDMPKLVFVGSFGGGGSGAAAEPPPYVLGTQVSTPPANENADTNANEQLASVESADVFFATSTSPAPPTLSATECLQTLATDGCLLATALATTTIRFDWSSNPLASYYIINKNGTYATTTENTFDAALGDFSDYTFEVVAVSTNGTQSATSTQKVSVASIPLAINEIAWMGTVASTTGEWFEIKNNTEHTIDLSGWDIIAKDSTPHVKLKGIIKPLEYLIFERIDDTVVANLLGHQIYNGALKNEGEQMSLNHASTTLDQTPYGVWVAGENSPIKKSMERISSKVSGLLASNWVTNDGIIKNGIDAKGNAINGTPGRENSASTATTTVATTATTSQAVAISTSTATTTPAVTTPFFSEPSAPVRSSDLNKNGIPDSDESDVIASSTMSLLAGEYHFHNLTITNNAVLLASGDRDSVISTDFHGVKIVADNLTVSQGSSISADASGYITGPGEGVGYIAASYGGAGGGNTATSTYGSATKPLELGSGASSIGGGAIRIIVSGTLLNDGSISANGSMYRRSSGGSVYVNTRELLGKGVFAANGTDAFWPYYWSGGGGRIAVYYEQSGFIGSSKADAGSFCYSGCNFAGQAGTVAFFNTATNDFYADSTWRFQKNDGPFNFNRIIVSNGATVTMEEEVNISANELIVKEKASFTLSKGSVLAIPTINVDDATLTFSGEETLTAKSLSLTGGAIATVAQGHPLSLTVNNLNIEQGSAVSVSYAGYLGNEGPGVSRIDKQGGASYGGIGQWNTASSTYGSEREPVDMGSGGSGNNSRGGGALRLIVLGNLVNNGSISASGANTASGGSIYLNANNLSGNGEFRADGGGLVYEYYYIGAGGGGRIAVYYNASTFAGSTSAGGQGSVYGYGGDGTIVMEQMKATVEPTAPASETLPEVIPEVEDEVVIIPETEDTEDAEGPVPDPEEASIAPLQPLPTATTTPPTVTNYTFNGVAGDITVGFSTTTPETVDILLNASEAVNWMSVTIEDVNDRKNFKRFLSGKGCEDGGMTCSKTWDGTLSSPTKGLRAPDGVYRIKVHMKDLVVPANDYNDYLSPYFITVSTATSTTLL